MKGYSYFSQANAKQADLKVNMQDSKLTE